MRKIVDLNQMYENFYGKVIHDKELICKINFALYPEFTAKAAVNMRITADISGKVYSVLESFHFYSPS